MKVRLRFTSSSRLRRVKTLWWSSWSPSPRTSVMAANHCLVVESPVKKTLTSRRHRCTLVLVKGIRGPHVNENQVLFHQYPSVKGEGIPGSQAGRSADPLESRCGLILVSLTIRKGKRQNETETKSCKLSVLEKHQVQLFRIRCQEYIENA